jgi:hypothetical protein
MFWWGWPRWGLEEECDEDEEEDWEGEDEED